MGETAAKLRLIFGAIAETRAVYFFDEFDAIGRERGAQDGTLSRRHIEQCRQHRNAQSEG